MQQSKNILMILGHPNSESFCNHLAETYTNASIASGHKNTILKLGELKFDPNLHLGYKDGNNQKLEPDLLKSQELISQANHIVFVFPNWWSSMPGLLKGWIDRVFLPGFSFQYQKNSPFPLQMLKEKTARIIITMDAPTWYYKWVNGAPGLKLLKKGTLEFCGIKPVNVTLLGNIRGSSANDLAQYSQTVQKIGSQGA